MKRLLFFILLVFFFGALAWGAEKTPPPSKGQKEYAQAVALTEKGNFDEAIPHLQKAIELDKQLAAAYYALAVCEARKKKPDTAAARQRHKEAIALGYERSEWLETYCDQIDKRKPAAK